MSKIVLNNISKSFGHTKVLEDINLEVMQGEVLSLFGESGCGKTTTLKLIAGIISPDKGDIFLGDERINDLPIEKRRTVIVFQDYLLFPHLNIEKNIGFGLKMAKMSKAEIAIKVDKMLELVSLKGYNKRYPHELSGGQRQRVALARAVATQPRVLLLDEPFSNLDANLKENVRDLIMNIQRELNITTIMVTHEKEEAMMYSDKIAVMINGKIEQFGTPEYIYNNPQTYEIANLLGKTNVIERKIKDGYVDIFGQNIKTMLKSKNVKVIIRSEGIIIEDKAEPNAKIHRVKFAGERKYYELISGEVILKATASSNSNYKENQEVGIRFLEDKIHMYEVKE